MENGIASTEQFLELAAAVTQHLPKDMDAITCQEWITTNRPNLKPVLRKALLPFEQEKAEAPKSEWQRKFTVFERELLATLALVRDIKHYGFAQDWELLLGECQISLDAQFQNVLHPR